jgi:hypothetical protein
MALLSAVLTCCAALPGLTAHARRQQSSTLPLVEHVASQPLIVQLKSTESIMRQLGVPISAATRAALQRAYRDPDESRAVNEIQKILDPYCLLSVHINPEAHIDVTQGPAKPELVQKDWRLFLVKVHNEAGITSSLRITSPNMVAAPEGTGGDRRSQWIDARMFDIRLWTHVNNFAPNTPVLTGLPLEYRLIQVYSRDAGKREATVAVDAGAGTQDPGHRNEAEILFDCVPTTDVVLRIRDESHAAVMAMFDIHDMAGRVYPSLVKRRAPDFWFHSQVYRADGETVRLPKGELVISYGRGPEYLAGTRTVTITGKPQTLGFTLKRWIDPSTLGWWSGDHHIHAAGCAHYEVPSQGVLAADMMRHCMGEDLKVGCNLTWGPCFDYQKQFFTGQVDKVSQYPYLLRYDIEVSGFGSHQSGHLCLLRLKDQIYPGGDSDTHWPTLCLNTLRWAKRQGAVCGPAHSGWGLQVPTSALPNYIVPPFDGIGANEYIVDVTHTVPGPDGALVPAVDFMAMVDTPSVWELNMWYHTLNCGYRTRISGETDFPCIYDERVGLGRSYVKLDGKLDFDRWCEGIRNGRNYVSDGRSHLMEFKAGGVALGENGSELHLANAGKVHVTARVAARLDPTPNPGIQGRPYDQQPYWHLERARIGSTRTVPVEVIVNGYPVARQTIVADGTQQDVAFDVNIERSSWIALRILPSSHTNPIFVMVGDKPIRASRRSAEWCLKGVDQCWSQKQRFIKADEMDNAKQAYEHAREAYQQIVKECEVE